MCIFNWSRVDIQYYISFRCKQLFDIYKHYKIPVSVVTVCHPTKLSWCHWLYSLCCACVLTGSLSVPLNLLQLFCPFPKFHITTSSLYLCVFFSFFFFRLHIQVKFYGIWLILLRMVPSRSIYIVTNGRMSLFVANIPQCVSLGVYIYLYPSVDGHLYCFHVLATVNDTKLHIYFQIAIFVFFG